MKLEHLKTYAKNLSFVCILLFMVFSFSGCSIRKANTDSIKQNDGRLIDSPAVDTDGDGLPDSEEKDRGTNVNKKDSDDDGLSDYDEVRHWNTNPLKADSDGDGYKDGEETSAGYDPLGSGQLDPDHDGLGSADEKKRGTDPEKFDTDGDGLSDKEEIDMGRNPTVAGK